MNHHDIVAKLNQIVEQAQLTLENPSSLTRERQKMIIALARFVSNEMSQASSRPTRLTGALPEADRAASPGL